MPENGCFPNVNSNYPPIRSSLSLAEERVLEHCIAGTLALTSEPISLISLEFKAFEVILA